MTENDRDKKVKVVDRRWFTTEGELKEPAEGPAERPAEQPPARSTAEPVAAAGGDATGSSTPEPVAPATEPLSDPEAAAPEPPPGAATPPIADDREKAIHVPGPPGFLELVDSLAQPAIAFLSGQVPGRGRDLQAARYYIDLLSVLDTKTRGQLSLEEKNVLDDVLYQLRSLYVAASR